LPVTLRVCSRAPVGRALAPARGAARDRMEEGQENRGAASSARCERSRDAPSASTAPTASSPSYSSAARGSWWRLRIAHPACPS